MAHLWCTHPQMEGTSCQVQALFVESTQACLLAPIYEKYTAGSRV